MGDAPSRCCGTLPGVIVAAAVSLLTTSPDVVKAVNAAEVEGFCSPMAANRPVCARGVPNRRASFLDPIVTVVSPWRVRLAEHVYVGPFARLLAGKGRIRIGTESNVQDNVRVFGAVRKRDASELRALRRLRLAPDSGVKTGERVIVAHGSTVKGPARLGVGPVKQVPDDMGGTVPDSGVFVSFGAEVDGAILARASG